MSRLTKQYIRIMEASREYQLALEAMRSSAIKLAILLGIEQPTTYIEALQLTAKLEEEKNKK